MNNFTEAWRKKCIWSLIAVHTQLNVRMNSSAWYCHDATCWVKMHRPFRSTGQTEKLDLQCSPFNSCHSLTAGRPNDDRTTTCLWRPLLVNPILRGPNRTATPRGPGIYFILLLFTALFKELLWTLHLNWVCYIKKWHKGKCNKDMKYKTQCWSIRFKLD